MDITDLQYGDMRTLGVQPASGGSSFQIKGMTVGQEVWLKAIDQGNWVLLELSNGSVFPIEGVSLPDRRLLSEILPQRGRALFWIAVYNPSQTPVRLLLQTHTFATRLQWSRTMDIGVKEALAESVTRMLRRNGGLDWVLGWLTSEFLLPGGNADSPTRAFLSSGPKPAENVERGFRLYGASSAADIRRNEDDRLEISRVSLGGPGRSNQV